MSTDIILAFSREHFSKFSCNLYNLTKSPSCLAFKSVSIYLINMPTIHDINWFPGHMAKARNRIEEKLKRCHGVIEIGDARAPRSSFPDYLDKMTQGKVKVFVFSKIDLADPVRFESYQKELISKGITPFSFDLRDKNAAKPMLKYLSQIRTSQDNRYLKLGFPLPAKYYMVLGIPNVGKSTFINALAGKKKAAVENKPGKTRSEPLIHVSDKVYIFDTPGILEPNYEDKEVAAKLALLGSIRMDILPLVPLTDFLYDLLKDDYRSLLEDRYEVSLPETSEEFYDLIAQKRGMLLSGSQIDSDRARKTVLTEFRNGVLGRISLDE